MTFGRNAYYVIYRESGTGRQLQTREVCRTEQQAADKAREFNRHNQDMTWNAVVADVQTFVGR